MMCPDGYSAEVPIALWQTKKVYKSKVKMAVFEMLLCQHSKKGPPFMGSALAAHKQYLNGSKKLLTQKIMWVDTETRLWTRLFSARSAIFCRYWTCTFSCRNNQAIEVLFMCG